MSRFSKEHMQENKVYKRKFRWTVEGTFPGGEIEQHFVKVKARPELIIEEELIDGINFAKSQKWESITITSYSPGKEMWSALYESHSESPNECPPEKKGTVTIRLYDVCDCLLESWELRGAYLTKVKFIECDVSGVELTIQYENVKYMASTTGLPLHLPTRIQLENS